MPSRININGVVGGPDDSKISVLDHGLLFGDSVYETLRTYNGKPFLFSRHFARLERSAHAVDLHLPWDRQRSLDEIHKTLFAGECRIRLIVTRGIGDVAPDVETCTDPTSIIIVVPLVAPPERIYRDGVDVMISSVRRSSRFADIKTGSLIHQVLARREAKAHRAYEAILLTADEKLSDGITSNIYMVRDRRLLTPSHDAGIVEGITRGVVLDLAREMGLEVVEGLFDVGEIGRAGEMFLTSSTREVVPIASVDGKQIGAGVPGPVTMSILRAYREAIERLAAEE
jgi:branched-chain amino acid aminotransferase